MKSELKPTPLTVNSSLSDAITFLRNFSTYILSGNGELDQLPEGMIAGIVRINVDNFWMKMLEGWGFGEQTTLQEFISMGNEISKNRSSVYDRRVELFGLKHTVLYIYLVNKQMTNMMQQWKELCLTTLLNKNLFKIPAKLQNIYST